MSHRSPVLHTRRSPWAIVAIALTIVIGAVAPADAIEDGWRVIDGDTLAHGAERIRIASIDTPERNWRAECEAEARLAELATRRLERLISEAGRIELVRDGVDRYGRTLGEVVLDARPVSELLISEGYAVPWEGRRHDWCGMRLP
jgi:endonuclease YncB( thermonuclease family)